MMLNRLLVLPLAAVLALAACGSSPPKARLEEQQQQRDFAARGYPPAAQVAAPIVPQALQWRLKGELVRWSLLAAPGPQPRPVLLYLPGLGENETAGLKWRQAWAASGLAVLSLQPLEEDAQAWSSDLARAAEFHALGQRHHAEAQVRRRVLRLNELLAEARRRGSLDGPADAPWRGLDWSRLAVAGFDLGAQTAQALAGETLADGSMLRLDGPQPRAVLLISPHVGKPDGAASRFQSIQIPVLSITGPHDEDLLGLVAQPGWRELPFQQMPSPARRLLRLDGINHRVLAGQDASGQPGKDDAQALQHAAADSSGQGRQGGRRGGGGGGGMGGGTGGEGRQGGMRAMAPVPNGPDWRGLHEQQLGLAAALQVSRAFLDAHLGVNPGSSASAQRWLDEQAPDWLRGVGQLKR